MRWMLALLITLAFATACAVVSFWVLQNSDQTVQFRLDLTETIGAWRMTEPMQATLLAGACFGGGFLSGVLIFGGWGLSQRRRANLLEAERSLDGRFRN